MAIVLEDSHVETLKSILRKLPQDNDDVIRMTSIIDMQSEYFPLTSVHREDVVETIPTYHIPAEQINDYEKFVMSRITDDQMEMIADRLTTAYLDNGYWEDLDIIVEDHLELGDIDGDWEDLEEMEA